MQSWSQEVTWEGFNPWDSKQMYNRCKRPGYLLYKHNFRTYLPAPLTPHLLTKWQPFSLSYLEILKLLLILRFYISQSYQVTGLSPSQRLLFKWITFSLVFGLERGTASENVLMRMCS